MWRSFGIRKLSKFIILSLTLYLIEHHLTNLRGLANALTSFASNHFPRVFLTISPTRAPSTLPWCQEDWWNDNPSPPHQELQCWLRPSRPSCKSSLSTNPPLLSFPGTCIRASCSVVIWLRIQNCLENLPAYGLIRKEGGAQMLEHTGHQVRPIHCKIVGTIPSDYCNTFNKCRLYKKLLT